MLTTSTKWNLPEGVRFDGPQAFGVKTLLVFTDYGVSHGTFTVRPEEATPERLLNQTAALRRSFRPIPSKTPLDSRFAPDPEHRA